jgi:hypothetical protein
MFDLWLAGQVLIPGLVVLAGWLLVLALVPRARAWLRTARTRCADAPVWFRWLTLLFLGVGGALLNGTIQVAMESVVDWAQAAAPSLGVVLIWATWLFDIPRLRPPAKAEE